MPDSTSNNLTYNGVTYADQTQLNGAKAQDRLTKDAPSSLTANAGPTVSAFTKYKDGQLQHHGAPSKDAAKDISAMVDVAAATHGLSKNALTTVSDVLNPANAVNQSFNAGVMPGVAGPGPTDGI